MYTAFCQDCKSALSGLWESVQAIHAAQTRNADSKVYTPDYTDSANAKLEADKKDACKAAREKIAAICDRAHEDAATLDALTPLDIDPDDKADKRILTLLGGQFTLNVEQLQHIVDEYVGGNRALLNAVATYCEVRGMKLNRATTASRRSGIKSIRESALSIVSKIENTSYKNGGHDFSTPLVVRDFCSNSDAASELCGRLGQKFDGTIIPPINDYSSHRGERRRKQIQFLLPGRP